MTHSSSTVVRRSKTTIFIDKDANDPFQGWGWVDVDIEVVKRFQIPNIYPTTRTFPPEVLEQLQAKGKFCTTDVYPPARGRTAGKKFVVNTHGEAIYLSVQKSLSIAAVCFWVQTWAAPDATIVTAGNRTLSIAAEPLSSSSAFVYFILHTDSQAIKIGKARNLEKRLKSLQTASAAKLKLLKSMHVASETEATQLEASLHQKFAHLRLAGEWFRAETELLAYLNDVEAATAIACQLPV